MRRFGCLAAVAALILIFLAVRFVHGWTAEGPATDDIAVIVPEGATLTKAAGVLEKVGAIRDTTGFLRRAKLLGSDEPIRAGEYEVTKGVSESDILSLLQSGKVIRRLVTVPEGMPSILVYERLMRERFLTGAIAIPKEGSILPDSYSFERGESRAAVLKRMQDAMRRFLAEQWKRRAKNLVVSTPEEAITLASIVEKETALPSERKMVAGVYANRLRAGMRLQADPTIIYPITRGRPLGRRIKESEINAVNDYNTYAMAGLPKGPICNPGRKSIEAVLHPADTKALYFVADGTGGHVFADTLEQHNANVAKWFEIRRKRGEM